jgi:hypothetical protein
MLPSPTAEVPMPSPASDRVDRPGNQSPSLGGQIDPRDDAPTWGDRWFGTTVGMLLLWTLHRIESAEVFGNALLLVVWISGTGWVGCLILDGVNAQRNDKNQEPDPLRNA